MFETTTAALTIVVFLVPGYVWRTVESQFVYLDKRLEWEKFALGLLARSTAIYALFAFPFIHAWQNGWLLAHPTTATLLTISLVGILPAILGLVAGIVRQREWLPRSIRRVGLRTFEQHQIPTAWDFLFSRITPRWAIVTFKNGSKLYGYIDANSYFSSDRDARDFYLSRVLHVASDGKIENVPKSAGVYIREDEVSLIEFIEE